MISEQMHKNHPVTSLLGGLVPLDAPPATMTSLELADLLGARHDHVRTSIQRLAARGSIELPAMREVKNHLHQRVKNYVFAGEKGRRDSIVVAAQLSPELTAAIVDRWQQLEIMSTRPVSAMEALQIALELEGRRVALAERLEASERHANMLENHFSQGMTAPQFCRCLNGVNIQKIMKFLESVGWLYHRTTDPKNWFVRCSVRDVYMTEETSRYSTTSGTKAVLQRPVLLKEGAKKLFDMYLSGRLPMKDTWNGRYEHAKAE